MRKPTVALCLALGVCAGCGGLGLSGRNPEDYVKPTIAVMKFENRAGFPLNWSLGDGMQEILVDRLLATGRYHVVERQELGAIMNELKFQQGGATRPQGKAATGRIRNCRYLIKGAVTDFGHVSANTGALSAWNWDFLGGSNRAVMGIVLYVVDVESGEIIASENIEESVSAKDLSVKAAYEGLSFGGSVFYQTPLGRATKKVVDRAIKRITTAIASQPWEPQVALVQEDGSVIINGGKDRGVKSGAEFEVLEAGKPIVDPATGDAIGQSPGRSLGRLIVHEVKERYSTATIVVGRAADLKPGQACRASG
jgi:curli biogenesis system outer membrane secretion channel CsgG